MGYTILDRLFEVERIHKRAAPQGGFSVPVMQERAATPAIEPVLVTNTRGAWVQTRTFAPGNVRCGIFSCLIDEETAVFQSLLRTIQDRGWDNRCTSVPEALEKMRAAGIKPRSIVIPEEDLPQTGVDLKTAEYLMRFQGYVSVVDGVQTLVGPVPAKQRLVVAADAGVYLRSDDYIGVMVFKANRSFSVVS